MLSTNADLGGAPRHVHDLAVGLAERGLDLHVAFGEDGVIRERLAQAGVSTAVIPGIRSVIDPVRDLGALRQLLRHLRSLGPIDLLHAHSTKAGMLARMAGPLLRVPVIYTVHGWGFGPARKPVRSAIVRAIEFGLRPVTRHHIVVSGSDGALGERALGLKRHRYSVVRNAVPDSPLRARPGQSKDFLMLARAAHPKDHEQAIRAFAQLRGEATLTLVGGDTDSEAFMAQARLWAGASLDRIRFLGARSDVEALLADTGCLVLFSRFEGMPLSILEGMRAGLPIIATRVGGIPEVVLDGVNGRIVPSQDVPAAAAAMQALVDDADLRHRMGQASRERFEREISNDSMIEAVLQVYRESGGVRIEQCGKARVDAAQPAPVQVPGARE